MSNSAERLFVGVACARALTKAFDRARIDVAGPPALGGVPAHGRRDDFHGIAKEHEPRFCAASPASPAEAAAGAAPACMNFWCQVNESQGVLY